MNKISNQEYGFSLKYIALFIVPVIIDQISKLYIAANFSKGQAVKVIPGFFEIRFITNKGAAWGMLSNHDWGIKVLGLFSFAAVILLAFMIYNCRHKGLKSVLTILAAGTAGNMIDRIFYGEVIDFLSFIFGSYKFPVFNVADILISCSMPFIAYYFIKEADDHSIYFSEKKDTASEEAAKKTGNAESSEGTENAENSEGTEKAESSEGTENAERPIRTKIKR